MSADNYWVVRAVEGGRFAVVMGFASDDYDESGGYPAVGSSDRRFSSLDDALAWTLSDEAGFTEYNTVVHPECLDVVEGDGGRVYCVEVQVDVVASPSEVDAKAAAVAASVGGYVSAIFDENWNEL